MVLFATADFWYPDMAIREPGNYGSLRADSDLSARISGSRSTVRPTLTTFDDGSEAAFYKGAG